MIRPFTCVSFLLACGSGLYLYQSKHRVNVLDRANRANRARDRRSCASRSRLLHAEWTLLNEPDRLQKLADQFLTLKTDHPAQFTILAELDSRLPPCRRRQPRRPHPRRQPTHRGRRRRVGGAAEPAALARRSRSHPASHRHHAVRTRVADADAAGRRAPSRVAPLESRPTAPMPPRVAVASRPQSPSRRGRHPAPRHAGRHRPGWMPARRPSQRGLCRRRRPSTGSLLGMAHSAGRRRRRPRRCRWPLAQRRQLRRP